MVWTAQDLKGKPLAASQVSGIVPRFGKALFCTPLAAAPIPADASALLRCAGSSAVRLCGGIVTAGRRPRSRSVQADPGSVRRLPLGPVDRASTFESQPNRLRHRIVTASGRTQRNGRIAPAVCVMSCPVKKDQPLRLHQPARRAIGFSAAFTTSTGSGSGVRLRRTGSSTSTTATAIGSAAAGAAAG